MSRFVKPDTSVLTLANGDKLIVKKRLNRGEKAAMFAAMRSPGGGAIDAVRVGLAKVLAYLIDWELQDEHIAIRELSSGEREQLLNSLDPDYFLDIKNEVDAHEERVQSEHDAGKARGGERPSPAISPSADGSAGDTTGSAI